LPSSPPLSFSQFDLLHLWTQGDAVTQTTVLILAAMSVTTWYVVVVREIVLLRLLRQGRAAETAVTGNAAPNAILSALTSGGPFHDLAQTGLAALERHREGLSGTIDRNSWLSLSLSRAVGRVTARLGDGLPQLATIASTAPFVGLFGTVWSIHHALTEIGVSGQASIERVAGPVGESLVMTALGLAVAVPAVLAHNWLVRRQKSAIEMVRGFGTDLHALLLGQS
jgi:biopolymer transport protein ExbB